MAKQKQTKSECTAVVVYEGEYEQQESIEFDEPTLISIVKEHAQKGFTRGYVARHLRIPEDEFEERFGLHFDDALEELGAQLTDVLKIKSFDNEAPVNVPAAKFLLERIVAGPKELTIIGAKNSARPIVKPVGETSHIREPKMSDGIYNAWNKEKDKVKE